MMTHFVRLEIAYRGSVSELQQAIAVQLRQHGEPLRWAITEIDAARQIAYIEAVVTIDTLTV